MPAPKYFQTEKECNKAYRLYYTKNFTYEEIGKVFGTSKVIVKNLFKRKGWKARDSRTCQFTDGRLSKSNLDNYCKMYVAGYSIDFISKKYKFTAKELSKELKSRGIFQPRETRIKVYLHKIQHSKQTTHNIKCDNSPYNGIATYTQFLHTVHYITKFMRCHLDKPKSKFKISLDHKYSIHDAYYLSRKNPPTVFELSHPANLEYMRASKNGSKNYRSSITLGRLRKDIKQYNMVHGDPFKHLNFKPSVHTMLYYGVYYG